jgi:hypothetical protein
VTKFWVWLQVASHPRGHASRNKSRRRFCIPYVPGLSPIVKNLAAHDRLDLDTSQQWKIGIVDEKLNVKVGRNASKAVSALTVCRVLGARAGSLLCSSVFCVRQRRETRNG